jgi:hypothetical protein
MDHPIKRLLIRASILALVAAIIVVVAGFLLGWKTAAQFSDGFFWAGAAMISIGLLSVMGAQSERTVTGLQYSQSAVHLDSGERFKIWAGDMARSHWLMAFLGIAGVWMFALAALAVVIGKKL